MGDEDKNKGKDNDNISNTKRREEINNNINNNDKNPLKEKDEVGNTNKNNNILNTKEEEDEINRNDFKEEEEKKSNNETKNDYDALIRKVKDNPHYINFPENYDAYVVEFYAPWCPHCQEYKPVYVSMAKEVISRTSHERVSFLALSCTAYEDICMTYNISGFPSIRGFRSDIIKDKLGLELNSDDEPELTPDRIGTYLHLDLIIGNNNNNDDNNDDDDEYDDNTKK